MKNEKNEEKFDIESFFFIVEWRTKSMMKFKLDEFNMDGRKSVCYLLFWFNELNEEEKTSI